MRWYVIYTKPKCEKKVEEQLLSLGINAYCPTRSEIKIWRDRKKKIDIPVLKSMVLVNINDKDINRVFESPLVVKYMFWLGKRAVVRQSEVDILKEYLDGGYNLLNSKSTDLNVGNDFKLSFLNNEKGIISLISKKNIWIDLKSKGYSVKLKFA